MKTSVAGMPPAPKYCRACGREWYEGHYCGTGAGPSKTLLEGAIFLFVVVAIVFFFAVAQGN